MRSLSLSGPRKGAIFIFEPKAYNGDRISQLGEAMAQVWTIIRNTGEWAKLERGVEIKDVTCPKDMRRRAFSKGFV